MKVCLTPVHEGDQAMNRILLDTALRQKLGNLEEPFVLCDESGRTLGQFVPTFDQAAFEGLDSPISREELQKRKQNKGRTYSTAEVLAQLEKT